MKTARSNFGLGENKACMRRRDYTHNSRWKSKAAASYWRMERSNFFQRNLRYAVAAKSYRLVRGVTQAEVAKAFGVTASSVCYWESGKYAWQGGDDELEQYHAIVRSIAR